jgi:hypothetical protein
MRTRILVAVLLCSSLAAAARHHLRVVPSRYDPDHTQAILSHWTPFGEDGDPAIVMAKILPTDADAAALAAVEGVADTTLDELGFDVFAGGHCGAGAPRFNVTTSAGAVYFFGCAYGKHAPAPDKPATFSRVRFGDGDAFPQYDSDPPWPGFGKVRVRRIDIVFDEGTDVGSGFTAIDDIDIDGEIVEGPRD